MVLVGVALFVVQCTVLYPVFSIQYHARCKMCHYFLEAFVPLLFIKYYSARESTHSLSFPCFSSFDLSLFGFWHIMSLLLS